MGAFVSGIPITTPEFGAQQTIYHISSALQSYEFKSYKIPRPSIFKNDEGTTGQCLSNDASRKYSFDFIS